MCVRVSCLLFTHTCTKLSVFGIKLKRIQENRFCNRWSGPPEPPVPLSISWAHNSFTSHIVKRSKHRKNHILVNRGVRLTVIFIAFQITLIRVYVLKCERQKNSFFFFVFARYILSFGHQTLNWTSHASMWPAPITELHNTLTKCIPFDTRTTLGAKKKHHWTTAIDTHTKNNNKNYTRSSKSRKTGIANAMLYPMGERPSESCEWEKGRWGTRGSQTHKIWEWEWKKKVPATMTHGHTDIAKHGIAKILMADHTHMQTAQKRMY